MKIGFNLLLWATHVTEDQFSLIDRLAKVGYDGVEVPIFEGRPEHFAKIGQVIRDNGMSCTTVTVMPDAAHDAILPDAQARSGALDYLRWALECTQAVGGEILGGPIHQALGRFSGEGRTNHEWARGVEVHRAVAEIASRAEIALSLEPLNRFECYFLNTVEDASAYAAAIDRNNVGILYDTFHANIEEQDPVGVIAPNVRHINHVHISANDRGTPGRDHIPWKQTFSALKSSGYDGWLTIEAFGRALPDLAAATRVWRDLSDSPEDIYEFGFRHIRDGWDQA